MFYIHVLDETMAYQVDQILDMVDKDDHETLEAGDLIHLYSIWCQFPPASGPGNESSV